MDNLVKRFPGDHSRSTPRRRPGRAGDRLSAALQVAWIIGGYSLAGLTFVAGLVAVISGADYGSDPSLTPIGLALAVFSPFLALAPLTVAHALKRADQLLDLLDQIARHEDA